MKTSDFDYYLPPELIAQRPPPDRPEARMMIVNRDDGEFRHACIANLPDYLMEGDLLVVNNTRVIPARIFGHKDGSGGNVELLLLEQKESCSTPGNPFDSIWNCLCRMSGTARKNMRFVMAGGDITANVVDAGHGGEMRVQLCCRRPLLDILEKQGVPPVPPYIKREKGTKLLIDLDRTRYQTVYAQDYGSVAAPTAGLHFTQMLLEKIKERGVNIVTVTLHIGLGTFKPVKTENIKDHRMESERYIVNEAAAEAINATRRARNRIIAVGSTTVRTLETIVKKHGCIKADSGRSSLFIHPPYEFQSVDAMLTNFHLPKSTLIMMVSALAGRDVIMRAYEEAIKERYRFYSYGDCMLIL